MQELMVLSGNPKRRKRKARRRAGKRRAHKMSALQMKYFGGGRANPKRRRRRRSAGKRRHVMAGVVARSFRRARRSGSRGFGKLLSASTGSLSHPMSMIGGALTGAIGAAAVNTVLARLPIPAPLMAGKVRYVTQGALAIGLGMLASKFGLGSGSAAKMAEGSLTVTLHQLLVEISAQAGFALGGVGYYLPGRNAGQAVPSSGGAPARMAGMGKYLTGPGSVIPMRRGGMGNINSFKF